MKPSHLIRTLSVISALSICAGGFATQSVEKRVAAAVKKVDEVAARGPFKPAWESLERAQVPDWYLDAKFGVFIHWGMVSAPDV
jgi:alpha-L-fucosidase